MGVYDSRGNYSPTPSPCLQPERKPASPPVPVYTWENPPPRLIIRPEPEVNCFIGVRFCWDNGEYLSGCNWALTQSNGEVIRGTLDGKSFLSRWTVGQSCKVQLEPQFDPDRQVVALRNELQSLLNEIIAAEREQAAAFESVQDQRSGLANAFHAQIAYGEGFLYAAWGHANTAYEFGQLANPYNALVDAVVAAWQAKVTPEKGWLEAFNEQFTAIQHQELAEVLGFDPSAISREQLAKAYEVTNYIFEDEPSRSMLARFAGQYVKVQNRESILYFTGAMAFEIVFAALLVLLTGGAGLAARGGAAAARLSPLLLKLGETLERLGVGLKKAKTYRAGKATPIGSGAQTVELPRPKAVRPARVSKAPTAGVIKNAARAIINPEKLISYALNPDHKSGGPKARVFESALGFTKENADDLMEQIRQGVRTTGSTPGKIDEHGPRFTVDIWVKGPKGEGMVRTGWIYDPDSEVPRLTTAIVR